MWWSRSLLLLAVLALGPAGCGFSPIYAKNRSPDQPGGTAAEMAEIAVAPISDRLGQQLRNALVQGITPRGEPGAPRYLLAVTLSETAGDLGYRRDSFATLGNLTLTAGISLTSETAVVLSSSLSTVVYFDYLGPRYASVVTERDAEERAVTQLSEAIRTQVAAALVRYRGNPNDPRYRLDKHERDRKESLFRKEQDKP